MHLSVVQTWLNGSHEAEAGTAHHTSALQRKKARLEPFVWIFRSSSVIRHLHGRGWASWLACVQLLQFLTARGTAVSPCDNFITKAHAWLWTAKSGPCSPRRWTG